MNQPFIIKFNPEVERYTDVYAIAQVFNFLQLEKVIEAQNITMIMYNPVLNQVVIGDIESETYSMSFNTFDRLYADFAQQHQKQDYSKLRIVK